MGGGGGGVGVFVGTSVSVGVEVTVEVAVAVDVEVAVGVAVLVSVGNGRNGLEVCVMLPGKVGVAGEDAPTTWEMAACAPPGKNKSAASAPSSKPNPTRITTNKTKRTDHCALGS